MFPLEHQPTRRPLTCGVQATQKKPLDLSSVPPTPSPPSTSCCSPRGAPAAGALLLVLPPSAAEARPFLWSQAQSRAGWKGLRAS